MHRKSQPISSSQHASVHAHWQSPTGEEH
jgi:hypothetical protein